MISYVHRGFSYCLVERIRAIHQRTSGIDGSFDPPPGYLKRPVWLLEETCDLLQNKTEVVALLRYFSILTRVSKSIKGNELVMFEK